LVILTVAGGAGGYVAGKYLPWLGRFSKMLIPVSVAATVADMLVLEACAAEQTLVPDGPETPPGVNPYDPNDPWNW